jgi:SPP1 gp7 family putative phage head morphogenesis protein
MLQIRSPRTKLGVRYDAQVPGLRAAKAQAHGETHVHAIADKWRGALRNTILRAVGSARSSVNLVDVEAAIRARSEKGVIAALSADFDTLRSMSLPLGAIMAEAAKASSVPASRSAQFNPDQPRDEHGQWADSGASSADLSAEVKAGVELARTWESAKPWNATADELSVGVAGVSYNPTLNSEARNIGGKYEVGPKFLNLNEDARRQVLYHELGHDLSDAMLQDRSAWALVDEGAMPGGAKVDARFDTLNGQTTPGEVIAEAYALLHVEPAFLHEHFPDLAKQVISKSRAYGFPLPGARHAADALRDLAPRLPKVGPISTVFNLHNPRAVAWITKHTGDLIAGFADVDAVRAIVKRAFNQGFAPRIAARLIRSVIGLNAPQAEAVANLRDRIAASAGGTIQAGSKLLRVPPEPDEEFVDAACSAYSDRLLKQRAETIAHTESMRASNQGQIELWNQAIEDGMLDGTEGKRWVATPDKVVCDICADLDGETVGLDEEFSTGEDPPQHPNCRCTVVLDVAFASGAIQQKMDRTAADWDESAHPRNDHGEFTDGGSASADAQTHLDFGAPVGTLVGDDGKPLVLFHGTVDPDLTHPDPFYAVENDGAVFFTDNEDVAWQYTSPREYGEMVGDSSENVIAANIVMKNPMVVDMQGSVGDALVLGRAIKEAKSKGHDGAIFRNIDDTVDSSRQMGTSYAVFSKTQVVPLPAHRAALAQPVTAGAWTEELHPRDQAGKFSDSASVSVNGAGYGQVQLGEDGTASYAGLHESEWTDWAYDSAHINDAVRGEDVAGRPSAYDGATITADEAKRYADIGARMQHAAESNVAVVAETGNTVFRGESYASPEAIKAAYPRGAVIATDRLTSTTTDPEAALAYATSGDTAPVPVRIEYQQPGGIVGIQTAPMGVPSNEIVMPLGAKFRVSAVIPPSAPGEPWRVRLYQKAPAGKALPRVNASSPALRGADAVWDEALHPRDEHGEFTDGTGAASRGGSTVAMAHLLAAIARPDGGFTVHPITGEQIVGPGNFAVSVARGREREMDVTKLTEDDLAKFIADNAAAWRQTGPDLVHFGGWHDPKSHRAFLDISRVVHDANEARQLAIDNDQISYFDFGLGKSVDVGVRHARQDEQQGGATHRTGADRAGSAASVRAEAVQTPDGQGANTGGNGEGESAAGESSASAIDARDAEWSEALHPRSPDGKFGDKSGAGSGDLHDSVRALRPQLVEAVQRVYDEWEPDPEEGDPEVGFGGICDKIAGELGDTISSELGDVDIVEGTQEGDEHANIIVHDGKTAFLVDVWPGLYESGSGYNYSKIKGVKFHEKDIEITPIPIGDVEPSDSWTAEHAKDSRRLAGWDESLHPREKGGEFTDKGSAGSTVALSARAARALASHKPSTATKQNRAALSEARVARAIGGTNLDDNEPMDVVVHDADTGKTYGVEVKTLIDNAHDKVTCHPDSRERKVAWGRSNHASVHTVVVDARVSPAQYYYKRGVGAFRLGSMERVALTELRTRIGGRK